MNKSDFIISIVLMCYAIGSLIAIFTDVPYLGIPIILFGMAICELLGKEDNK